MDWSKIVLCNNCGAGNPCDADSCLSCKKPMKRKAQDDDHSQYLIDHPPRCLAGFDAEGKRATQAQSNISFALTCGCGGSEFSVLGHFLQDDKVFVGPLALQCAGCGKTGELIDTDQHGYDAELGHGSCTMRGDGPPQAFTCPHCGLNEMTVRIEFEYPDDLLSDDFFEDYQGRRQDLFTWFFLKGKCSGCGGYCEITDFECA